MNKEQKKNVQYDAYAKYILSQKEVLARKNSGPSRGRLSGIVVACILLHLALAPQIHLFGGAFNFMLVLTVSLAISLDSRTMVYVGFFSGLLYDLTTTGPVGLMSLLLALVGCYLAIALIPNPESI